MLRRTLLMGWAAPALYPELQNPQSPRGRALADFARSLEIKRGIAYVKRPEGEQTLAVYAPRERPAGRVGAVLAFGLSAFRLNETEYRWDLERLMPAPTANLYPPILARRRVVIVANLRTAPGAPWPAQRDDARAALDWVRRNADQLGIDAARVGLFGSSASGNLASLLALTTPERERVRCVCSMAGIYDFEYYAKVDSGDGSLFKNVLGQYLGETQKFFREASPAAYVHAGAPPFLLLHGRQDGRVPFSQMPHFASLLRRAGVAVETVEIDRYQHGPLPGEEPNPGYAETDRRIYTFFDRHLNPENSR